MYEEEDDDMPWQYRRLGLMGDVPPLDPDFQRKFQAQMAFQVERSRILAQAVANVNQQNGQQPRSPSFQAPSQFMNPGMMQMQQSGYQNYAMPQQNANKTPSTYRQTPYPISTGQQTMRRPTPHQRSTSIATPNDGSMPSRQWSQSTTTTPTLPTPSDDRRMSLPQGNTTLSQRTQSRPIPSKASRSPNYISPITSAHASSGANTPGSYHSVHSQLSQQQLPTPPQHPTFNNQGQASYAPSSASAQDYTQDFSGSYGPLTTTLQMETQQMFGVAGWPDMYGSPTFEMKPQPQSRPISLSKQQQPFYNYNPNGKIKEPKAQQPAPSTSTGLNQTLAPMTLDTGFSGQTTPTYTETPLSAYRDAFDSSSLYSNQGFGGFGYDDSIFRLDPFMAASSGQVTPDGFSAFVDGEMFADPQQAY